MTRSLIRGALVCLLAFPVFLHAQGGRIGDSLPVQAVLAQNGVTFIVSASATQIAICNAPANAVPCTNVATTYTDRTLTTPCATSTQLVLAGTTNCVSKPDNNGNWGAWIAPGEYEYTISTPQGNYGPFPVSVGLMPNGAYTASSFLVGSGTPNGAMTPILSSVQYGSSANYIVNQNNHSAVSYVSNFNGTPQSFSGYCCYGFRVDTLTAPSVDVQSTVGLASLVSAHSTNSLAPVNYDKTTQVAMLANSSAPDTTSSASVEGLNTIVESSYTGTQPQNLISMEADVVMTRQSGPWKGTQPYSVGVMIHNNSNFLAQYGAAVDELSNAAGWHIGYIAGNTHDAGFFTTQGANQTPLYGFASQGAQTAGFISSCANIDDVNLYTTLQSDCTKAPPIAFWAGQKAVVGSAAGQKIRWSWTNGGVETVWDSFAGSDGYFHLQSSGGDQGAFDGALNLNMLGKVSFKCANYLCASGFSLTGTPTGGRTLTAQDASYTIAGTDIAQTWGAVNQTGMQLVSPKIGGVSLGNVPEMTMGGFLAAPVNVQNFAAFIPTNAMIITRLTGTVTTAAAGCATFPVWSVFDNTASAVLTSITAGTGTTTDSGALSVSIPGGHTIFLRVTTAASGCGTNPANLNLVMQYRMN